MKLHELRAAIKERCDKVQAIFREADEKQDGVCTKEQRDEIKSLNQEIEDMEKSAKSLEEQDAIKNLNARRLEFLSQPLNPMLHGGNPAAVLKSIGAQFVDSEAFKTWFKNVAPHGQLPAGMRLQDSQAVMFNLGLKTLLTGSTTWSPRADTSANALVQLDQRGLLDTGTWRRPLRIAQLCSVGQTDGDTIEYVRVTGVTNNAAPTAEATATGGSSGSKPESAMAFEVIHDRVKTIPHWIPATRRALSDAAQLRTLIDTFLRYGIDEVLEDQIIGGDGTGENFTGIRNVSGVLSQAYSTDILTTSRKALTNITLNGRVTPTAWVMHPNDWEDFDLLQDNEGRYYWGGPNVEGTPRLWGVPVVQSEAATEGEAILGNWSFAQIWDREQTTIRVSDSHSDFFIRNLIAILAEMRAGFGIIRPKAFLKADLTA